ncbi:MAG: allergen V5/Tpx-1-like protein [Comamonadaceae bacterium]|nr:MAG: allergen V5/Tpx-1-like protein [Comamonadaceae bacterium]
MGGWNVLQNARASCGFGVLTQNTKLDAAALSHARYLNSVSIATGTSVLSHYETSTSNPYYTGYYPWDRTSYQGYGTQVAEILEATSWTYLTSSASLPTRQQRGEESMRSLLNTVYHLIGAMYHGTEVGFGTDLQTVASGTLYSREEYRFGSLNGYQSTLRRVKLGTGNVATYPCQGSTNIPSAFIPANETPNPFPSMTTTSQTVGPPIYLKVDAGQVLKITSGSVIQAGLSVPVTVLTNANDPNRDSTGQPYIDTHEAFVVPTNALNPNTTYQVDVSGTVNGTPFTRSFSMSTGQ